MNIFEQVVQTENEYRLSLEAGRMQHSEQQESRILVSFSVHIQLAIILSF